MDETKFVVRLHDPRRWRLLAAGVVAVLALGAWGLFDAGRRAGGYSSAEAAREQERLEERIGQLEEDKRSLQADVARLNTTLEIDLEAQRRLREDLQDNASQLAELNEELAFYRRIMAPADGQQGLRVQAFEVTPGSEPRHYRLKLVLVQSRQRDARTSGELDVQLQGQRNGEQTRLSLVDLAAGAARFDFRYFQDIDLEVALPEGFEPEIALVELTPRGRGATPVSASFPWSPTR